MSSQRRGGLSAQTSNQGAIDVPGRGASRAPSSRMPISDLYALMMGMEARMNAQDEEIRVLKKDNAALWQEVHRVPQLFFGDNFFFAHYTRINFLRVVDASETS
ncbi:hypothetical protein C8R43DRAFT_941225 [Mycena crocata]|nr:hypothetical protein C8R43DRAFT_941225 [Mycena crocata]